MKVKQCPTLNKKPLISSNEKAGLTDKKYIKAVKKSHLGSKQIIDKVITINKLDAICGLTMGPAFSIDMIYGDRWEMFFNNTCSSEWLSTYYCALWEGL
jgi:amidase